MRNLLLALILAVPATVTFAPAPASAYAPAAYVGAHGLRGWIASSRPYFISVRANGRWIPVDLHRGTVIAPLGLTLERGMYVNVAGYWNGGNFVANRVMLAR